MKTESSRTWIREAHLASMQFLRKEGKYTMFHLSQVKFWHDLTKVLTNFWSATF